MKIELLLSPTVGVRRSDSNQSESAFSPGREAKRLGPARGGLSDAPQPDSSAGGALIGLLGFSEVGLCGDNVWTGSGILGSGRVNALAVDPHDP